MTTLNCPGATDFARRAGKPFEVSKPISKPGRSLASRARARVSAWQATPQVRYMGRLVRYTLRHKSLLLLTLVAGVCGFLLAFVYPWLIGAAIDRVIAPRAVNGVVPDINQRIHWLMILCVAGVATAIGHGVVGYVRGMGTVHLGHRIVTQLRTDLFDHFQRLSLHFYAKERTGSIAARLLHDVHSATNLIYGGIIVVGLDVAQLIIAVVLLLSINVRLALGCIIVLPLYAFTFKVLNPKVRQASENLHHHYCQISGTIQEQLAGIALIKTYAAEEREHRRFSKDMTDHHHKVCHQSHVGHLVGAVSEVLVHAGTMVVVGYGSWLALKGQITAGDMTRCLGYVGIMYAPVRRFAELNTVYQNSVTAIMRVFRVFDITPKIADKPDAVTTPLHRGDVRFENVKFRYQDDSEESRYSLEDDPMKPLPQSAAITAPWVLKGLNFSIKDGERVAFVGPSGAGKTTLISLLPRLYDVGEGAISIDGVNVRDYSLKALRSGIGIVQQDSFIFSGTIRDNLAYGKPDATDDEVVAAARAANAHDFISALPEGYNTELGERGVNLSGGQRQRLSIARALLKNPRILILDEATSALDTESERLVQGALETLMKGRTCLIIAHRLSTVRNADRIMVLKDGQLVEQGRHDELLAQHGLYARLVKQQFGNEAPVAPALAPAAVSVIDALLSEVGIATTDTRTMDVLSVEDETTDDVLDEEAMLVG